MILQVKNVKTNKGKILKIETTIWTKQVHSQKIKENQQTGVKGIRKNHIYSVNKISENHHLGKG